MPNFIGAEERERERERERDRETKTMRVEEKETVDVGEKPLKRETFQNVERLTSLAR